MRTPMPALRSLALAFLVAAAPLAQDIENSRELAGIAEEQAQVQRQLGRLRSTMEVLLARLEAEGRAQTAELLRGAIAKLDARSEAGTATRPMTMEERMGEARTTLTAGQLVQSIERQQELVAELEELISILLDRKNFEALEERIAELRELREEVDALAAEEAKLREETRELQEGAANDAQRELQEGLAELVETQRELLAKNEELGRASGTLELEQLERELERLRQDQAVDAAVIESWDPGEAAELERLTAQLAQAQRAEQRSALLRSAAEALERASRETEAAARSEAERGDPGAVLEELEAAASRAELARDASGDEAAARAAEALRRAAETLERSQGESDESEASGESLAREATRELNEQGATLRAAAAEEGDRAQAQRSATEAELEALRDQEGALGRAAEEALEALDQARAAHDSGRREEASHATDEARAAVDAARKDLEQLGDALAGSQNEQAQRAERLDRGLSTLPNAKTPAGTEAGQALREAAEAMRSASSAARRGEPGAAATEARRAEEALGRAQEALASSRQEASRSAAEATEALAAEQADAARSTAELEPLVPEGSMEAQAQERVTEAVERAQQAMERAAEDLAQGRSASAAQSQREAMQALQEAGRQAQQGIRPRSGSDRARAEELAQEQERIREEILDLARRIQEREEADSQQTAQSMERAAEAANQATDELSEGDLARAQESEREVEQELKQTHDALQEEEERYQRLRDEEQLFRIAEELKTLLEGHRGQMGELVEIHAQRRPDSAPSRAQRLRLRRVAREEESLAERARELSEAIAAEGAMVSAQLLANIADDLDRIATDISEEGDYETGERTQALQRDVEESILWLIDALQQEQNRRKQESQEEQQQQQQGENKPGLIPDSAELKLLRRMEVEIRDSVDLLLTLHPDLADDIEDVEPRVLREVSRLALRHGEITGLFRAMRQRIGVPDPEPLED